MFASPLEWLLTPLTASPAVDLARLVAVPVFAWAAYRDVETRRVPNRTWPPLAALGVGLLAVEGYRMATGDVPGGDLARERFLLSVAVSLGLVAPVGYLFYWFGGFGGADAKALIVLAVLFPTFPTYILPTTSLPLTATTLDVFSLTILTNTVVVGAVYPLAVAGRNALGGHTGKAMLIGKPVRATDVPDEYGSLMETPDGFTRHGLDIDALRMYLRWRGCSLADVRADPETCRDPASLPEDPNPPGDGSIAPGDPPEPDADVATDGGRDAETGDAGTELTDPWGAAAFLEDIEGDAYGTTPEKLRDGLEVLVAEDVVWVSPGLPFIVPMFVGLVVSLVYGDLLVAAVSLLV
ncbi:MAG: A24 family peptidase C-terminal domain-containing protein [Haloarculaceae archaeon]